MVAVRTVKPAAAMVVAQQDGFAALTSWVAAQQAQPVREMDTANKISRCCRKLLLGLLIVTLRKYMQN